MYIPNNVFEVPSAGIRRIGSATTSTHKFVIFFYRLLPIYGFYTLGKITQLTYLSQFPRVVWENFVRTSQG